MADIKLDISDFERGLKELEIALVSISAKTMDVMTDEVMRLSTLEVPHDTGALQTSLGKETEGDVTTVGFNKVYAARLHEHPEYRFKKGRKGKYLIDPIVKNLSVFHAKMQEKFNEILIN
jgi:hypothetical protein